MVTSDSVIVRNLAIINGTLDINSNVVQSVGGAFTIGNSSHLIIGNTNGKDHFPNGFNQYSYGDNFTVEYDGAGNAVVNIVNASAGFRNLTIGGSGTKSLQQFRTVSQRLTLEGSTLATNDRLTLGAGAVLVRAGSDTEGIITGTIGGGYAYTVRYEGTFKTTQNGEWSGTGDKTWQVALSPAEILTAHTALTVGANLLLDSGTLNDGGHTLTVKGNITNNSIHTGSGKLLLNGNAMHTLAGSGTGVFGNLELDDTQGALLAANQQVDGILTLTNGVVDADTYLLAFGADASVSVASPDHTRMIQTSGTLAAAGVQKYFSGAGSFWWPVGMSGKYTPATLTISTATEPGSVTLKPVGGAQPNASGEGFALDYYWQASASGLGAVSATYTYTYDQTDQTGRGNEYAYVPAHYDGVAWRIIADVAEVDEQTNAVSFASIDYLAGEFTAGEPSKFGLNPSYYSLNSPGTGNWNDSTSWQVNEGSVRTIPGSATTVILRGGFTMDVTTDHTLSSTLSLFTGTTLRVADNVTDNNFGTVFGSGTMEIITNDSSATSFPAGTYSDLTGAVVYSGTGSYTFDPIPGNTYPDLTVTGTGNVMLPPTDTLRVAGDLTNQTTLQTHAGVAHQIILSGHLTNPGVLALANGTDQTDIIFNGTAQSISGSGTFTLGSVAITQGASITLPGDVTIAGDLEVSNGAFSTGTYLSLIHI